MSAKRKAIWRRKGERANGILDDERDLLEDDGGEPQDAHVQLQRLSGDAVGREQMHAGVPADADELVARGVRSDRRGKDQAAGRWKDAFSVGGSGTEAESRFSRGSRESR